MSRLLGPVNTLPKVREQIYDDISH